MRDRPSSYDQYLVADLTALSTELKTELLEWQFDCLTVVAALGFADIPVEAFQQAYDLVADRGWICFNIRTTFVTAQDTSGFAERIREMVGNGELEVHRMIRYRHRYSIDGEPLMYYGIIGRKMPVG